MSRPGESRQAFERALQKDGQLILTPVGNSMWPLFENNAHSVLLKKPEGALKRLDVALYERADGSFVFHRNLGRGERYVFCGDSQTSPEYGITDRDVIAVMRGFYRGKKYHSTDEWSYRLYSRIWCAGTHLPARRFGMWVARRVQTCVHGYRKLTKRPKKR